MLQIVIKFVITAAIVVAVSEINRVSDKLSALLIALPITSLLAMFWMHTEEQGNEKIASHAESTFWFVLPTLPMFLVLPWMLRHGWGFWPALGINALMTIALFFALAAITRACGMNVL